MEWKRHVGAGGGEGASSAQYHRGYGPASSLGPVSMGKEQRAMAAAMGKKQGRGGRGSASSPHDQEGYSESMLMRHKGRVRTWAVSAITFVFLLAMATMKGAPKLW